MFKYKIMRRNRGENEFSQLLKRILDINNLIKGSRMKKIIVFTYLLGLTALLKISKSSVPLPALYS